MIPATRIDLYQLTSLVPHWDAGLADDRVWMAFFSRRLPRSPHTGETVRDHLLWAGLGRCLDHLEHARFDADRIAALRAHPVLGPPLEARPELVARLADWRFSGTVRAPREGTPLLAGPALRQDGSALACNGVRPAAYCPYLLVETDLLSAKLIETPLLSTINHMTMVASKATRVVAAARRLGDRSVLEFGSRRTHPAAAVDAAVAAYIAGAAATSNVEAYARHGVPVSGTMDHFAVQAWEQPDTPRHITEGAFFRSFHDSFPGREVLLVDTYDTFGAHTGIRAAVAAAPPGPMGIRLDSGLTVENIRRARALLDSLGAHHTKIFVSGGMDEHAIAALGDAPVDGYGIGERIVTSPDAPVGVGAVGKLCMVSGRPTMKLSRGSGKATLPGIVQVWRTATGDVVGLEDEAIDGTPLLEDVWSADRGRLPGPTIHEVRAHAAACRDEPLPERLVVSDRLAALVEELVGVVAD